MIFGTIMLKELFGKNAILTQARKKMGYSGA
jgi:hypothetical protein